MVQLAAEVNEARRRFIETVSGLSKEQLAFMPAEDAWCINQVAEHMVWAEYSGINGMYRAIEGIKNGTPVFTGKAIFEGMPIEEVISKTWKPKEQVPPIAKPHWGGPVDFWIAALISNERLLDEMVNALARYDPVEVIYPHVLSGPLNAIQRFEFLRFHLDRHIAQVNEIKNHPSYPIGQKS